MSTSRKKQKSPPLSDDASAPATATTPEEEVENEDSITNDVGIIAMKTLYSYYENIKDEEDEDEQEKRIRQAIGYLVKSAANANEAVTEISNKTIMLFIALFFILLGCGVWLMIAIAEDLQVIGPLFVLFGCALVCIITAGILKQYQVRHNSQFK